MPIYHLTNEYRIALSVYEVERETAQLYFVHKGKTLTSGYAHFARRLRKDDRSVFTERATAIAAYRRMIEQAIADRQRQIDNLHCQLADADTL